MWIFTETGFISAVKKPRDNGLLSLRARNHTSLEPIAKAFDTQIINTPRGDYPWRTFLTQEQFASWLAEQALKLNYENFKCEAHQTNSSPKFIRALHDVWAIMTNTEDAEARGPKT